MRYRVDLKKIMSDCETNYYRLKKLMSGLEDGGRVEVALPGERGGAITIDVVERTPYTSLVEIRQSSTVLPRWVPEARLCVRLYHDARLAEVVNYAGMRNPRPRYLYPNVGMFQPDEKAQWNTFLSDWLMLAIGHGFAAVAPCEFAG